MEESEDLPSIETLGADIKKLQDKVAPKPVSAPEHGGSRVMRMGVELISGAFVGGAAGYYLDKWLGTSPFLFILCFFLGSAGGFLTLLKTVRAEEKEETRDRN